MYKLTGFKYASFGNSYLVLDTDDKVTELLTDVEIKIHLDRGVVIEGLTKDANGNIVRDDKYIKEALENFKSKVMTELAKAVLLRKGDKYEELSVIASKLGVNPKDSKLIVDFDKGLVSLPYQNTTLALQKGGATEVGRCDLTSDNITEFTKQGHTVFSSVDVVIDGINVTLRDCVDALYKLHGSSLSVERIQFIAYTPSNMIFKVISNGGVVYSVKFNSWQNTKRQYDKIMKMKTTTSDLRYYLEHEMGDNNPNRVIITKISRKHDYDRCVSVSEIIRKLMNKYTTLRIVYIRPR